MDGRFLEALDVETLTAQALEAEAAGVEAVFVSESPLGDPVVLASGLSIAVRRPLIGIRTTVTVDGRHPAILARELTCLDLVCGGRAVLCLRPPFIDGLAEVMTICRRLWREGSATGRLGPFRVDGAVNRPRGSGSSPLLALDLTQSGQLDAALAAASDLLIHRGDAPGACVIERLGDAPVR
jgi:alkanesulfonate monooxygenase SsuD/methylene tetrahydromethanopterin reductase-like flavin-dependent oxidoreductase (luciferase family)